MKKEALLLVVAIVLLVGVFLLIKGKGPSSNYGSSNQTPSNSSSAGAGSTENVAQEDAQISQIALTISSPVDGATVTQNTIVLSGKTTPGAEVFANDQVGRADASGNFSFEVTLDPGQNEILVDANDANGNAAEKDITVTYNGQ